MSSDRTADGTATTLAPTRNAHVNGNGPRNGNGQRNGNHSGNRNGGNPRLSPVTRERAADEELQRLVHRMLELLQEDPSREGLLDTPTRVQKSLKWLTHGYRLTAGDAVGGAIFEEDHGSLVVVKDIEFYSLCEHHMLPFFGRAHIGYVPSGRVLGLSKMARLVDVFARRLQVQERLTEQVAAALEDVLEPAGVGVVVEAHHLCMMMRGVQKQNSSTVTSAVRGSLATDAGARAEFLRLATGSG